MFGNELKKTKDLVFEILQRSKESRNSDDILYINVCEAVNPIASAMPLSKVLRNRKEYGIPNYESVRRARQKLQAEHPELAAVSDVEAGRMLCEQTYREFAKGVN